MQDNLINQIPAVMRRLAQQEQERRLANLEAQLAQSETTLRELQTAQLELAERYQRAKDGFDQAQRALSESEESGRAALEAIASHVRTIESLEGQLSEAAESSATLSRQRHDLNAALTSAQAELAALAQAMSEQSTAHALQRSELEQALAQSVELNSNGQTVIESHEKTIETLVTRLSEVADDRATLIGERDTLHAVLAEREAQQLALVQERDGLQAALTDARSACDCLQAALAGVEAGRDRLSLKLDQANAEAEAQRAAVREELEGLSNALRNAEAELSGRRNEFANQEARRIRTADELEACRALSGRCIFIVGFARSNTTITLEMLNCAKDALILGEAAFYIGEHGPQFRDWYNRQHIDFGNQVTKSSYAPDFVPNEEHAWWQWLEAASQEYERLGEKIALAPYHLEKRPPEAFRSFYESRFFSASYIFMLRNPHDVLMSSAKLFNIVDDRAMAKLCVAWLDYMQIWADSIRVFPNTLTLPVERFESEAVDKLERFTGLDLGEAARLLNPANTRRHKPNPKFRSLNAFRPDLEQLYALAMDVLDEDPALWQAEQKSSPENNNSKGDAPGAIAVAPRPLGQLWIGIQSLRESILPCTLEPDLER